MKIDSTTLLNVEWGLLVASGVAGKVAEKRNSISAAKVCLATFLLAGVVGVAQIVVSIKEVNEM